MVSRVRAIGPVSSPEDLKRIAHSPLVERSSSGAVPLESVLIGPRRKPKNPLDQKSSEILDALKEASLMLPAFYVSEIRLDLSNGAVLEIERNRCVYTYPASGKMAPGWQHSMRIETWAENIPTSQEPPKDEVDRVIDSMLRQSKADQSSRAMISRILSSDKGSSEILLSASDLLRQHFEGKDHSD
jgi:hypothetical protein